MQEFLATLLFRGIFRTIGQYTRYYFFKLIGRKRTLRSLSNESKDEYKDMGNALKQDFLNAVAGIIVFLVIVLILFGIILR